MLLFAFTKASLRIVITSPAFFDKIIVVFHNFLFRYIL
jgi:hypothetical protein